MARLNMVESLNLALDQVMDADPSVVVMGEDVGVNGGVFRVTKNLFKKYGPRRVMDTPLAEAGIIGTAVGMAVAADVGPGVGSSVAHANAAIVKMLTVARVIRRIVFVPGVLFPN